MKIALTGGIACGKSLVARYLNEEGVATLDADDVVHGLIPPDERRRLAKTVFADPVARKALEVRIHPIVRGRINDFLDAPCVGSAAPLRIAIIPLLFEVHWERDFDIILCVTSEKAAQVARMVTTRGYAREEAEARLAAQLPVREKAAKSHYVIENVGSTDELRRKVTKMVAWLRKETENGRRV